MRRPHIYTLIPMAPAEYQILMQGIASYARQHTDWVLPQPWYYNWSKRDTQFKKFMSNHVDGCIAFIDDDIMLDMLKSRPIPAVDVLWKQEQNHFPVCTDDFYQSGAIAAEYLIQAGYYNLLFQPLSSQVYSHQLLNHGFLEKAQEKQAVIHQVNIADDIIPLINQQFSGKAAFLTRQATQVSAYETLIDKGYRIPQDLALLGYAMSGLKEDLQLPISCLKRPMFSVGYQAAGMLHRMLEGERPLIEPTLVTAEGIREDQTTSTSNIEDPELKQAVEFINSHFKVPINVNDIAQDSNLSRRSLERRFQARLKTTPQLLLRAKRMDHVRQLLINTDMPISLIASHSGFANPAHMTQLFKKHTQYTPRQYRSLYRSR